MQKTSFFSVVSYLCGKFFLRCIFLLMLFKVSCLYASVDLEEGAQDFVLQTKQLFIPGHPTACNPSIVCWQGGLILSFDAYTEGNAAPDRMGLVHLDDDFEVIGAPYILDLPRNLWQDARLMTVGQRLYLVSNGAIEGGVRRMFATQVHDDGGRLSIDAPECLLHFPGGKQNQWERNWVPFAYGDILLLASDLAPHRILQPLLGTQGCAEVSSTPFPSAWEWGTPKPGTGAHLDGDRYLALFHSVKVMATAHSKGEPIQHYFMGAYTFESRPPFAITSISKEPIIGKHFYHGPDYDMTKPCRVVFPCGFVMDDQYIWVVYGKQDHELWMAKLDKPGLYKSLN
jgi:hypothetical protein